MRKPEILAPAGDREALEAAVRAGADAVYFGLRDFNARARATNFDPDALASTMSYLHEHGVRGYVTLNTLVFDAELPSVEAAIRACAEAGVDAIIVQDVGLAKLAHAVAPSLPIHASTQMTCTDAGAVDFARDLGATRVILARELSTDDIGKIRSGTDAELEVFVHGALCVSYSGQCLTSEAIGGRSANRGACAQACRLPYTLVVDGVETDTGDRAYLLSPEDLEASSVVPELVRLGVSSLKIEGRLKGAEYVAATTRLYRMAVDAATDGAQPPGRADRRAALQTYSRGSGTGFFEGVDHQRLVDGRTCDHHGLEIGELRGVEKRRGRTELLVELKDELRLGDGILVEGGLAGRGEVGGRVWGLGLSATEVKRADPGDVVHVWLGPEVRPGALVAGKRVFRTSAPHAEKELERPEKRVPLDVRVEGRQGERFVLEARTDVGASARVEGDADIELARGTPLDAAILRDKLGRLGDTPFALRDLDVALAPGSMIPVSSLNRARRALVQKLLDATRVTHATTSASSTTLLASALPPSRPPPSAGLFVLCRTLPQALAAVESGATGVYLDFLELKGTADALAKLRERGAFVAVAPPRIRKPGEDKIDRYIGSLAPDAVLVRGLGTLRDLARSRRESGPVAIGDFSLNVANRITAAEMLAHGLDVFTPSFDLDGVQLVELLASPFAPFAEVVLHHPMPLFHMEHCVFAALLSDGRDYRTCGRPCERHDVRLRDRAGMEHPVEADVGCRNTVFHAHAQSAVQLLPELARAGVRRFRIEVVRETADDIRRLVSSYRRAIDDPDVAPAIWRELRSESGYGVVRGSLRVLA